MAATKLAEAYVQIRVDPKPLRAGLAALRSAVARSVGGIGSRFGKAGRAITRGIAAGVSGAMRQLGLLRRDADKTAGSAGGAFSKIGGIINGIAAGAGVAGFVGIGLKLAAANETAEGAIRTQNGKPAG